MNDSIFTPYFNITPEIKALLDTIDRLRWLIDHVLLMRRHEVWLHREIRTRRAASTTRIEAASLDEEAVGKLDRSRPSRKLSDDELANLNAIQAYEFIDFLSDQPDIPADELVIRQINRYFMAGAPELLTPGVYRKGQNTVGQFTPPDQGDVPGLMRSFALWLRQEDDTHPVIKAGMAHIHLIAVHPFWDGNGRTARGLSTLLLQRSTFNFKNLLSLESQLLDLRDGYFAAIEHTLGKHFVDGYDATPWLQFFALSLSVSARVLQDRLTDWHRYMQGIYDRAERLGMSHRQVDGLAFASQRGRIARSDYMEIAGVSPITASRDLSKLVELGLLVPEGKTRSRVYRPAKQAPEQDRDVAEEQLPLLPGDAP